MTIKYSAFCHLLRLFQVRPPVTAVTSAPAAWAVKATRSKRIQDLSRRADGMLDAPSRLDQIELIAMDIDGTLLDSQHRMSDRAENALRLAMAQGVQVNATLNVKIIE